MVSVNKFIDPRIDSNTLKTRTYSITQGGSNISYRHYRAMSHSTSQTKWHVDLEDGIYMSRRIFVAYSVVITFANSNIANPGANPPGATGNSGLRAYPLASVIQSISFAPGNDNLTNTTWNSIHALMRYGSGARRKKQVDVWFP